MSASTSREPLTYERVVSAAMQVADDDGLPALTMRRLAAELRCEAMSLYHHVPGKDALLAALADRVTALVVEAAAGIDRPTWIETERDRCLAAREVMLRHPWGPVLLTAQEAQPPSSWALFEQLVGTLAAAGFDDHLAHRAIHALGSMVFGFSAELFEPDDVQSTPDPETMAMLAEYMPNLTRMAAAVVHEVDGALSVCDTQAEFTFTLGLILDGLERARLATS